MTTLRFRKPHPQDLRFGALILLNLLCICGFFFETLGSAEQKAGAWRKADIEAIEKKIQAGDLTRREADWYRKIPLGEGKI